MLNHKKFLINLITRTNALVNTTVKLSSLEQINILKTNLEIFN